MTDPKDVILNAIRVLRSRRVRPSDAKIAWLARREFLQNEEVTSITLQELVECGDIFKVNYKGGTSYRVAPHKVAASNKLLKPVPKKVKFTPTPTDILRPLLSAIAACDGNATKESIAEKLSMNGHSHLVDRLDTILQKEVRVGLIAKETLSSPGERNATRYYITKSAPLALISNNFGSLQQDTPMESNESDQAPNSDEEEPQKSSTPFKHLHLHLKKLQQEKEKDIPKEENDTQITSNEPFPPEQQIEAENAYSTENNLPPESKSSDDTRFCSRRGRPRKAPTIYEDLTNLLSRRERGRTTKMAGHRAGKVIKKAKKVYDPSDASGKRKYPSASSELPPVEPRHRCDACGHPAAMQNSFEELLVCHSCSARAHPSCLGYSNELALKCRLGPWTCMDCKHCSVCNMDHNNGTLIFCDECDRAYHLTCHNPPIQGYPMGSWICYSCTPNPTGPNIYDSLSGLPTPSNSPVPDEENRSSSGSWDHSSFDPRIPNAAEWCVDRVMEFFIEKGFVDQVHVFKDQDIDGTALLMLTRMDVLTGLNLKLGPALKIYKHVRILQTRLPNPPLP